MKKIIACFLIVLSLLSAQIVRRNGGSSNTTLASYSYSYTNAAFLVASTTATITVVTLPANAIVTNAYLKHSTAIAGTGITAAVCSLGVAGDTDFYLSPADVFTTAAATLSYSQGGSRAYSTASHDLLLTCVANTNWGDGGATVATSGSLTVAVAYSTIQ